MNKLRKLAGTLWPVTLLAMIIFTPFLVKKSYDELIAKR